jgi:hypothetical protein
MAAFPGLFLLFMGFYAFAFGVTRLLLRRSRWEQYSLEAPWLTGPALIVLMLSAVGYRDPITVQTWQSWLVLAVGWTVSGAVVCWQWGELRELLRAHWLRMLTIGVPSLVSCAMMVSYFPGNTWEDVYVPHQVEYFQYAYLAASATGQHQGVPGEPANLFCANHRKIRIGQDLIIAVVAEVAGRHPIQVVVPIAVLFRLQETMVLGLLLCAMVQTRKQLPAVFALLLVEAVMAFELLSFASSFFSANCIMPLAALYFVWLARSQSFGIREGIIVILMNVFFLITYAEFYPIVKAFELVAVLVALWRGPREHWLPLILCNAALVLTHPLLIVSKCQILTDQLGHSANVGWNVMGHPLNHPWQWLGTLLGVRYGYLGGDPLRAWGVLGPAFCLVLLALLGVGLVLLARRYRVGIFLLTWVAVVAAVHAWCVSVDNFYSGFKILSFSYFILVLAAAATLLAALPHWRFMAGTFVVVWLAVAGRCTRHMVHAFRACGYPINYAELRETVLRYSDGRPVTALTVYRDPFCLLNLISGETGLPLVAVKPEQHRVVTSQLLGKGRDGTRPAPDGTLFQGLVLIDPLVQATGKVNQPGTVTHFECHRALTKIGVLQLCEGRVFVPVAPSEPSATSVQLSELKME